MRDENFDKYITYRAKHCADAKESLIWKVSCILSCHPSEVVEKAKATINNIEIMTEQLRRLNER